MYDSFLAVLSVVLFPVILWWIKQPIRTNIKYFGYFFILFFAQGSLELLGLNQTLVRFMFEIPLIVYFFFDIIKNGFRRTPGWMCVILFILFSLPSVVFTSAIMYLLFLQQFLLVWITFYCFYNARWSEAECESVHRLFCWLCVSQFFASILKYLIVGICEPYIGTMASHSGGLTTLFSLAGFTTCTILYFSINRPILLWGCIGFILFGLIGEKRALAFMIPVFLIVSFFIYSLFTKQLGQSFIKKVVICILLVPLLFYVIVRVNPSFNPEREVWGEFDLEYTINYAEKYNSGTLTKDKDNIGRSEAHSVFHGHILNDNLYHILFGYGAGVLVQSAFNTKIEGSVQEYSYNHWGIGYSISIGYLTLLAQLGFIGTIFYFLIYLSLLRVLYNGIMNGCGYLELKSIGYGISGFVCILVMLFLSLIYNKSAFIFSPVTLLLMWFIFYSYKQIYQYDNFYNSTIQKA